MACYRPIIGVLIISSVIIQLSQLVLSETLYSSSLRFHGEMDKNVQKIMTLVPN